MIYIAIGSNLPSATFGPPRRTVEGAIRLLRRAGITVVACSPLYESAPVPASAQPNFINGVMGVRTSLPPRQLLDLLHHIERRLGRVRRARNEARTIDLDLIAYHDKLQTGEGDGVVLPHPRMHRRSFVLLPMQDIAPNWRHPGSGVTIGEMIRQLPSLGGLKRL